VKLTPWLDRLMQRLRIQLAEAEIRRVDRATVCVALGHRGVTLHQAGDAVFLAPSFVASGGLGLDVNLQVQHQEIRQ
jgi:hypothetical protein